MDITIYIRGSVQPHYGQLVHYKYAKSINFRLT